jgi:hypothetical protein
VDDPHEQEQSDSSLVLRACLLAILEALDLMRMKTLWRRMVGKKGRTSSVAFQTSHESKFRATNSRKGVEDRR